MGPQCSPGIGTSQSHIMEAKYLDFSYPVDLTENHKERVVIEPTESVTNEATMFPLEDDPTMMVITLRSCLVGLIQGILGAAVGQLFVFKPVLVYLTPVFLQILCLFCGRILALTPGPLWWNPGPFTLKENVFASIIATSSRNVSFSILMLATEDLYFNQKSSTLRSLGILLSTQMIGYGWAGLVASILVYPSSVIFPQVLSSAALFYSVSGEGKFPQAQIKLFKKVFAAINIYEIIPTYLMPALQGLSIPCLAFPGSSTVTNLFGGVAPFEGLGFFELSFDWNISGAGGPLYTPLFAQAHQIAALLITALLFWPAHTSSWFGFGKGEGFPFLSVSLFQTNASLYPAQLMTQRDGSANQTSIKEYGLPVYTPTNVLTQIFQSLSVSASISHILLWKWPMVSASLSPGGINKHVDPHRLVVRSSYRDFPLWGWTCILVVATGLALGICAQTVVIPPFGLLVAISLAGILTLSMGFIYAISGYYMPLNGVCQMIGGMLFGDNALGNLWFCNYSSATASQALSTMADFKLGQYTHMPPVAVAVGQLSGMCVGVLVNYVVLGVLLTTEREALLLPNGNGIYSGTLVQTYGASAVTWGNFSTELYAWGQRYVLVPLALGLGFLLPVPFYLIHKVWPHAYLEELNVPILLGSMALGSLGPTAGRTVNIICGLVSQLWARKYHPQWFYKYNYVLSAALDGGTQIIILLLSLTLQGGLGSQLKLNIPTYFMNPPSSQPRDYCYMPNSHPSTFKK